MRFLFLAALATTALAADIPDAEHAARRRAMVEEIMAEQAGIPSRFDPRVLQAIGNVPRHLFVPPSMQAYAYRNTPLAIGHGQTISQPYIVALMTDLLKPRKGDRVLEIGTGSGYQAAVLAELVGAVYTVEIVAPLAAQARERLSRLGYANVQVRTGDGYQGWEEHAPFDSIIVTAGAERVPPPLLRQLKRGGRIVIPVGEADAIQSLTLIEKQDDGRIRTTSILPVRFVPFTRER
jgi:protein-L-isoaspartate(D-aspartate) O-methyltransferase